MYDLADGYDSWLDRLDALQDERTEPAPQPSQGRPYVRPANDRARLATSIREGSRRFAHRSHRHQRGEE